jgi:PhnB protein
MPIQPYLFFNGRCEEAIEFYKKAIGAELTYLIRFNESPDEPPPGMVPEGFEKKVMHAELRIGDAVVMVSDGTSTEPASFKGVSLALVAKDVPESRHRFEALSKGGTIQMPLGETFFSPSFGMLVDPFGVPWMVIVDSEESVHTSHARSA